MNRRTDLKKLYTLAKAAKVGDTVTCPSCGAIFTKTNYQQAFCKTLRKTECKDYYWNNVTPTKRNNTTRISPANAAYAKQMQDDRDYRSVYDGFHPFEGLNDDDYKSF